MLKRKKIKRIRICDLQACTGRLVDNYSRLLNFVALNAPIALIRKDIELLFARYDDLEYILGKSTFGKIVGNRSLINKGLSEILKKFC